MLVMPIGTEVVYKGDGSVGVVKSLPAVLAGVEGRRVLFTDHAPYWRGEGRNITRGTVVFIPTEMLEVRKRMSTDEINRTVGVTLHKDNVPEHGFVLFRALGGSRAYGLENDESDWDMREVFVAKPHLLHSLAGLQNTVDQQEESYTGWELAHFLTMALRANPNVLEVLFSPQLEIVDSAGYGRELYDNGGRFLSKLVYQTYIGYVNGQFKKLEADMRNKGVVKNKHAMHMIRLLISGTHLLKHGSVMVDVGPYRSMLLAIKHEGISFEGTLELKAEWLEQIEEAYRATTLPERPDYRWAQGYLYEVRQWSMSQSMKIAW